MAIVVVAVIMAGCGGASEPPAPFQLTGGLAGGGRPVMALGPSGVDVRFIERGRIGLGLVLKNASDRRVTITDVRTDDQPRSLVHFVGSRVAPYSPPVCGGGASCPSGGPRLSLDAVGRPQPLTLKPSEAASVELDYRLGTCDQVAQASVATPDELEVSFRDRDNTPRRQLLRFGSARMQLQMPTEDC